MTAPHCDDAALSAVLDGEDDAAANAHLAGCPSCQARLAALASVALKVATPVPGRPQPDADASVAAAMAAWSAAATSTLPSGEPSTPSAPAMYTNTASWSGRRVPPAAWPRRAVVALGGVAAALLAVGAIVVAFRSPGGHSSKSAASAPLQRSPSPSTTVSPVSSSIDLGLQSDPGTVARLLAPALAPSSAALAPSSAAKSSAPGALGSNVPSASSVTQPGQVVAGSCIQQLRSALALSADSAVALVASLEWRGAPAAAVVFDRPGGQSGAVVSLPNCAVLAILPM